MTQPNPNNVPKRRPNLYEHLGIPREATETAIRLAYRRKSKQTHPDAGGSPEAFAETKLAHDVLTDPVRRAQYDRDGTIGDAPVDNRHAAIAEILCSLFDMVCQAGAKNRLEPHQFDVVDGMRELCQNHLTGFAQQKKDLEKKLRVAESMGGRFKRKKKRGTPDPDNLLDRLMLGRCEPFRQALRQNAEHIERFTEVKAILADYEFKFDEPPAPHTEAWHMQRMMFNR